METQFDGVVFWVNLVSGLFGLLLVRLGMRTKTKLKERELKKLKSRLHDPDSLRITGAQKASVNAITLMFLVVTLVFLCQSIFELAKLFV